MAAKKKRSARRPVRQSSPKKAGTEQPVGAKKKSTRKATKKAGPTRGKPVAPRLAAPTDEAPKKVVGARTAPKAARSKFRPSAGPRILSDLGITDDQLGAFLPSVETPVIRGVFWCQFDRKGTLEDIEKHFMKSPQADRYDVSRSTEHRFTSDDDVTGVQVPSVVLRPKGKYVAYVIYGKRGEQYVADGRWQLEASFREMGTYWGSNQAVFERFKATELPALGAKKVVELTE